MKKAICNYCKKEFEYTNYKPKTCSKECAEALRKKTNLEKYNTENPTQVEKFSKKRLETIKQKYGSGRAPLKKPIIRICKICGKKYESAANYSIYCSEECKKNKPIKKYEPKIIKGICVICNKEFEYKANSNKRTCSKECRKILLERTNLEKYGVKNVSQRNENNKCIKIQKCKECGKEFKVYNNYQLYCSEECKKNKTVKCIICDKEFKTLRTRSTKTCSEECRQKLIEQTNLDRYGVKRVLQSKKVKEKLKLTNLERYDADNPMKVEKIKEKLKKNNLEKYGVTNPFASEDIKKQIKETILEKYGVEYPQQNKDILEKSIQTSLDRYGVRRTSELPEVKKKVKETFIENYGVDNPMKNPESVEKHKQTCLEKYGVPYSCMTPQCIDAQGYTISKINRRIGKLFEIGENDYEFPLGTKSYDLRKDNILIEIDPSFTHNNTYSYTYIMNISAENNPIDKKYHLNKTKLANEHGYHCIHIFDWDDVNKIKYMIEDKETLYARNLKIQEVPEDICDNFLNENHLQNTCKGQTIRLGLYKDNELIEIMTFGKPRYNKNYEYELLRLCTNHKYKVVGGSERLFKYFVENYKPSSIISYCDNAKFSGDVYNKLGFTLKSYGSPTCHWYNLKTGRHITNNLLLQRGFSQLHKDNKYELANKGDSNRELMINAGYVEVYDCGQSTFIWNQL